MKDGMRILNHNLRVADLGCPIEKHHRGSHAHGDHDNIYATTRQGPDVKKITFKISTPGCWKNLFDFKSNLNILIG